MKKIVIGASMRYRGLVFATMEKFRALGFEPLMPNIEIGGEENDAANTAEEKLRLAKEHYEAIDKATAAYWILPGGYMGTSCKLELGYAIHARKPIYFSELTNDLALDCNVKHVIPLSNLELFLEELK